MKKFHKWLKEFKKKYGWGAVVLPIGALLVGGGLTIWGFYMSGFDVAGWLVSPHAVLIYLIVGVALLVLLILWGLQ